MTTDTFAGKLVRLIVPDLETDPQRTADWSRDSEYMRLYDTDPAKVLSAQSEKEELEKRVDKNVWFMIQALNTQQVIGEVSLGGIDHRIGNAWLGIGIGNRDFWGKGYGTEATRLILGFGFRELNLRRVSLNVIEYNERAIHAYEKIGFVVEGTSRKSVLRCGRRWDVIYMGILREEWEARNPPD